MSPLFVCLGTCCEEVTHDPGLPLSLDAASTAPTGHRATGHRAIGHRAIGHRAIGHRATGHRATGHRATKPNQRYTLCETPSTTCTLVSLIDPLKTA